MFSRSRFPPRGNDESMSPSDMVRGLVPSMVRYKCCSHSDMVRGLVHSMVRYKCKDALILLWVLLPHDQCRAILM